MRSIKNLKEKLKVLENERKNLLLEIEELKKLAVEKTEALENEVNSLREEVESLRIILGIEERLPNFERKTKK